MISLNRKNDSEPRRKTLKSPKQLFERTTPSVFFAGFEIISPVTGREQAKQDLGVALPMQMRIFSQITHV